MHSMNENPYESAKAEEAVGKLRKQNSVMGTVATVAAVVVILGLVVALLLPTVRTAREPARRNSCMNNQKQIALALQFYHDKHGTFPPPYTVDADGNRLHSWRTLILPYMEQSVLYDKIDLTKPWDDPANAAARATVVDVYQCPSFPGDDPTLTTYLGVVGDDAFFSENTKRTIHDMTDGMSTTIAVVEVSADRAVHWMSPEDISPDEVVAVIAAGASYHGGGRFVTAFADGHVDATDSEIDPAQLRAMLTINGREVLVGE
jgi:prepilin-type processing-associated H-X9-DG protein